MHEHPAAVAVLDDRRGRTDRARVARHQRQGRLHGHHGYRPPPLSAPEILYLLLSIAAATARRHTGNTQISSIAPSSRRTVVREDWDRMLIDQLPEIVKQAAQGLSGSYLTVLNGADGLGQVATGLVGQGLAIYDSLRGGLDRQRSDDASGDGSAQLGVGASSQRRP